MAVLLSGHEARRGLHFDVHLSVQVGGNFKSEASNLEVSKHAELCVELCVELGKKLGKKLGKN